MLLGLIADTHGLLREEAVRALSGVDRIVHAGDIGEPALLERLGAIAPVTAVRGNNDRGSWARALPGTEVVEAGGLLLYVLHDLHELTIAPEAAGFHAVICGHSHRPSVEVRQGVLFVNPGSAGPRRFTLPVSLAFLDIEGGRASARIHLLQP
ncbi:MAG: metallophosphoesterase family protein [Pseudomonadota bacterium]|jgi:putative phosphoesterase